MHLLENIITDNIFATLWNYRYNLENRDPKIFINIFVIILTKATIGFIQSIERELFIFEVELFDSFRIYFNRTIYL